VPEELLAEWRDRDPIERYRERLVAEHGFEPAALDALADRVRAEMAAAAERALASPMPDPAEAEQGVFAGEWRPLGDGEAPWSRYTEGAER
jgi:TPP-dependent pyruvate/acetoin dehydrogenase alpha subunit